MARRLGIYTLGHYLSLKGAFLKSLWNPLLENYENWELSQLREGPEDEEILSQTFEGMLLTHEQILQGFFPLAERVACLERIKAEFLKNFDNLVQILSMEVHKPLSLARLECERGVATLEATIALGKKLLQHGETLSDRGPSFRAESLPSPRRLILGLTPFNFPINLCLHKIAPALLAGAPLVWRPSAKGQLTALALMDVIHAAKTPAGLIALCPMSNEFFWKVLRDPRVDCVSFTGSAKVGWDIHREFRGPTLLELGGAAPIYLERLTGDELDRALTEITKSAYAHAGQSCISAQSLFVQEDIFSAAKERLIALTQSFAIGKTWSEQTLCSSVIDEEAQKRIEKTLADAQAQGAELHRAPTIDVPNFVAPTLVEKPHRALLEEEVFAPVLNLVPSKDFAAFKAFANSIPHRLQCAVFSDDPKTIAAARALDFGGIAIGEPSSRRVDALPYGGRALAGLGAESPITAYAFYAPYKTFYTHE